MTINHKYQNGMTTEQRKRKTQKKKNKQKNTSNNEISKYKDNCLISNTKLTLMSQDKSKTICNDKNTC